MLCWPCAANALEGLRGAAEQELDMAHGELLQVGEACRAQDRCFTPPSYSFFS